MLLGQVTKLYPNNVQSNQLSQAVGTCRFAHNWGLDWWKTQYEKYQELKVLFEPQLKDIESKYTGEKNKINKATNLTRLEKKEAIERLNKERYAEKKAIPGYQSLLDAKPSWMSARKAFNNIKKKEFPWEQETTKFAAQSGFEKLGDAFDRFIKGQTAYPKYYKRNEDDKFSIRDMTVICNSRRVFLPQHLTACLLVFRSMW